MKKKKIQIAVAVILAGVLTALAIGAYLWFKPHRDVQATSVFATLKVETLVQEFTANTAAANERYLASDGNSKVLIVEGRVSSIRVNQNGDAVIVLKDENAKAGVIATFTQKTNAHTRGIKQGDIIKIKGAITAGNSYDSALDLYEHAVLVQCDIVK